MEGEGVGAHVGELVLAAEADVVRRDAAEATLKRGNHRAVEKAPGRLAVEQEDRLSRPLVEVVRAKSAHLHIARGKGKVGQPDEAFVRSAIDATSQRHLPSGRRPGG